MNIDSLKLLYDYIFYLRHNLPDLFCVLGLSAEGYSILDSDLKTLLISIDDFIITRHIDMLEDI